MKAAKSIAYSPYGAFELKRCYQKNMFLGTLISSLMALAVIAAFALAACLSGMNPDPGNEIPVDKFTGINLTEEPSRPLDYGEEPPEVEIEPPELDMEGAKINLIDDDEPYVGQVLATRNQKLDLAKRKFSNAMSRGTGTGIDTTGLFSHFADPEPNEFIPRDTNPILLDAPVPDYPEVARKVGIEAEVWIMVLVDTEGNVKDALVARSSGRDLGFDEAALDAAWGRKYRPAMQNDQPVAVWVSYKVRFEIEK